MGKIITMREFVVPRKAIIDQILDQARMLDLIVRNGVFFTKEGKYYGNMYTIAKEAGINM